MLSMVEWHWEKDFPNPAENYRTIWMLASVLVLYVADVLSEGVCVDDVRRLEEPPVGDRESQTQRGRNHYMGPDRSW